MKINAINIINYSNFAKRKVLKENHTPVSSGNVFGYISYSPIFFKGSYKKLSACELIAKIGRDNFPSPKIVKTLEEIGNSTDYSLFDIHTDYYKDLSECKTLAEAKEKYPEFKDVIDAKDINVSGLPSKSIIRKIKKGENKEIDINNLSLGLLKRLYGKMYSPKMNNLYFGITDEALYSLLKLLNIKKLNRSYLAFAKQSDVTIREKKSKTLTDFWSEDDGTLKEKYKGYASVLHTEEAENKNKEKQSSKDCRTKRSESLKRFNRNNPEYRQARKLAWERHPEITSVMSTVAKKYPSLHRMLLKKENGIELTEAENRLLKQYYLECDRMFPGYIDTANKEYHNILVEWGMIDEDSIE